MPAPLKTEAIVLRSIRYGEADRVLHLYTPTHGRIGAIAKGVRRSRSRFGARLEPFLHVRAVLHEGRGDLFTVTGVDTITVHAGLRDHAATLDAAARACDAVSRLFETPDPHPEVFVLLRNELALLHADPASVTGRQRPCVSAQAAARGRYRAAARGLRHVRRHRAPARLLGRGRRGRLHARAKGPRSRSTRRPTASSSARSGHPLAQAPDASERALRQAERAIGETAEHHAHVHLRPLLRDLRAA